MQRIVKLRDAGRILSVSEETTVLEAALNSGVDYPHSCRAGRCGACKSRLLSGRVELLPHSRFALSEEERNQGLVLACRSMPRSNLVITWQSEVAATPEVRQGQATVIARHEIAPGIHRLLLRSRAGPFEFLPGQYFGLRLPGAPARNFSPASQPGAEELEFHIRGLSGGAASTVLTGKLISGDVVEISGPYGDAYLRQAHQGPLLLLAASTGLAPIKSILDQSLQVTPDRRIELYVSARSTDHGYLWEYLENVARQNSNMRFQRVLTRDGTGRPIGLGLPDVLEHDLGAERLAGWEVHAAGPEPFVEAMQRAAAALGATDIYVDAFVTDSARVVIAP